MRGGVEREGGFAGDAAGRRRAAERPLQELGAVDARLQGRRARPGAVVLAEARVRRDHAADAPRVEELADLGHGGEEAAPDAVQEEQPAQREWRERECAGVKPVNE